MGSSFKCFSVLSWNVRGLGDLDKRKVVRDALASAAPSVICLQETKLQDVDTFTAHTFLPPSHAGTYHAVDSDGSRGRMLTAWDPNIFSLTSFISRRHTLTTVLNSTISDHCIAVTNVYGPSDHRDSPVFLDGLRQLEPHTSGVWLLAGDFNLVCGAADKSTGYVNTRLCDMFNDTIESLRVVEVPLLDKLFTWSNRRVCPTLERLDRVFVNNHQCLTFPATTLTSLVRPTSDHMPLLVTLSTTIPRPNTFRLENAWLCN
jgi:endonuclease/exonuclease/phosphatase family metal-dependent hydrolase